MADKTQNLTELKQLIKSTLDQVNNLILDRDDVNGDINALRATLAAKGIQKKAFDMARQYMKMDPDDREGFDVAYALVREAGGLPMQDDLFSAAERKGSEKVEPVEDDKKPATTAGHTGSPDPAAMAKVIQSQEAEKTRGKKVHEPTGEHKGAIN